MIQVKRCCFKSKLVNSGVGSPEQKEQDQEQLKLWRDELREQALSQFRAGNLDESLSCFVRWRSTMDAPAAA
jgi:hypothetical protein